MRPKRLLVCSKAVFSSDGGLVGSIATRSPYRDDDVLNIMNFTIIHDSIIFLTRSVSQS